MSETLTVDTLKTIFEEKGWDKDKVSDEAARRLINAGFSAQTLEGMADIWGEVKDAYRNPVAYSSYLSDLEISVKPYMKGDKRMILPRALGGFDSHNVGDCQAVNQAVAKRLLNRDIHKQIPDDRMILDWSGHAGGMGDTEFHRFMVIAPEDDRGEPNIDSKEVVVFDYGLGKVTIPDQARGHRVRSKELIEEGGDAAYLVVDENYEPREPNKVSFSVPDDHRHHVLMIGMGYMERDDYQDFDPFIYGIIERRPNGDMIPRINITYPNGGIRSFHKEGEKIISLAENERGELYYKMKDISDEKMKQKVLEWEIDYPISGEQIDGIIDILNNLQTLIEKSEL
jgi:hypothetical protein